VIDSVLRVTVGVGATETVSLAKASTQKTFDESKPEVENWCTGGIFSALLDEIYVESKMSVWCFLLVALKRRPL
jgi:hypothetical protein